MSATWKLLEVSNGNPSASWGRYMRGRWGWDRKRGICGRRTYVRTANRSYQLFSGLQFLGSWVVLFLSCPCLLSVRLVSAYSGTAWRAGESLLTVVSLSKLVVYSMVRRLVIGCGLASCECVEGGRPSTWAQGRGECNIYFLCPGKWSKCSEPIFFNLVPYIHQDEAFDERKYLI